MWCKPLRVVPITSFSCKAYRGSRQLLTGPSKHAALYQHVCRIAEHYAKQSGDGTLVLLNQQLDKSLPFLTEAGTPSSSGSTDVETERLKHTLASDLETASDDLQQQDVRISWSHTLPAGDPAMLAASDPPSVTVMTDADVERWKPALSAPNLDTALNHLHQRGVIVLWSHTLGGSVSHPNSEGEPPTWVVLYLLCHLVASPADAKKAFALAYHHLPAAPAYLQPLLLIFAACWLAEHNLVVPLQYLVKTLPQVTTWPGDYDTFLKLFCSASTTPNGIHLIVPLVEALAARGLPLEPATLDKLLAGPHATAELGIAVARVMQAQVRMPSIENLEGLLKLFAKARWRKRAGRCLKLLRHYRAAQDAEAKLFGKHPAEHERMGPDAERWYMASFGGVRRVHGYMRRVHGYIRHMAAGERRSRLWRAVLGVGAWRSVLRVAAGDCSLSAKMLLKILSRAKAADSALRADFIMDLIAINGLLIKRDAASALNVWRGIADKKDEVEAWGLALGVKVLTLAGRPLEAFSLLREIATPRDAATTTDRPSWTEMRRQLTTHTINIYMTSLQRIGRADIVFELWDHMETLFGVSPDQYTLAIVLKTARFVGKPDQSVQAALRDIGLGGLFRKKNSDDATVLSSEPADIVVARIQYALARDRTQVNASMWREERAGARALRLAQHVFLSNWPELRGVPAPVHAHRRTAGASSVTSVLRTLSARPPPPPTSDAPPTLDPIDDLGALWPYAQVLPKDVMFRAYVDLLGAEEHNSVVPRALAWMRVLGVRPSRATLATALVYWSEVSLEAPLVEHYLGDRSAYLQLIRWMQEWVGADGLPTEADIGEHLKRVQWFRDLRYGHRRGM